MLIFLWRICQCIPKSKRPNFSFFWKLNCLVSTCSSNPSRRRQSCFHILLSVLAGRYYSEPGQACKLVWRPLSVWDAATKSWSAFAGKLVPSRADNEKRFTHLQLFVAKHVAISKLVWQRSHNDRRVMGPQLPPTVKVGPGLNNLPRTNSSQEMWNVARNRVAWKFTKNQDRRWSVRNLGELFRMCFAFSYTLRLAQFFTPRVDSCLDLDFRWL